MSQSPCASEPSQFGFFCAIAQSRYFCTVRISRLTISVDARVLVSATETEVRIVGAEALRVGRPLFSVGGALGVRL